VEARVLGADAGSEGMDSWSSYFTGFAREWSWIGGTTRGSGREREDAAALTNSSKLQSQRYDGDFSSRATRP
jgi:hypothetical protein